jgi:hypothetical protein
MYSYESLTYLCGYKTNSVKKITWDNLFAPFIIGGISKSIASITLLPLNVVKMRLQMKQYSEEEIKCKIF